MKEPSIIDILSQISTTLTNQSESFDWSTLFIATTAGLIGVLSSFFLTSLHQKTVEKERRRYVLGKIIEDKIEELEKQVLDYWCNDAGNTSADIDIISTLSIQNNLGIIRSYIRLLFVDHSDIKTKDKIEKEQELNALMSDLFEKITGDDFGTSNHTANPKLARRAVNDLSLLSIKIRGIMHEY